MKNNLNPQDSNELASSPDPVQDTAKIPVKGHDMSTVNNTAYSVGHIYNDLTASIWFSYLLYYLTDILGLSKSIAALVMFSGQLFDGLATPLVGCLSDRFNTPFGKRTPWYIGGTFIVTICFCLIFVRPPWDKDNEADRWKVILYYITLPSLFNVGWAAVQISHMSLLPSISINKKHKDKLVRWRTGCTFLAQLMALIFSFFCFYYVKDKYTQYTVLAVLCTTVGMCFTMFFIFYSREQDLGKHISQYYKEVRDKLQERKIIDYGTFAREQEEVTVSFWLKKLIFWKNLLIYMLVRLSINITNSMLPYYLEYILGIKKTEFGGTPVEFSLLYLIMTVGCLVNSIFIQEKFERFNSRIIMMLSSWVFVLGGCLPIMMLDGSNYQSMYVFGFIFGIGFSMALSTASSLINDVVGSKGEKGAFVFGFYSFTDKLSSGLMMVYFMNYVKDDLYLLKYITMLLPVVAIFASLVIVAHKKQEKAEGTNESKSIIDNSNLTFL